MFPIPNSWYLIGGSIVLAFLLGMAVETKWATDSIQAHADAQMAAATGALIVEANRRNAVAQADAKAAEASEQIVHATLAEDRNAAVRTRDAALAQLSKEKQTTKDLADAYMGMVHAMENDRCGWSADARRVLNEASGAASDSAASASAPDSKTSGGIVGASVTAPAARGSGWLSCDDLFRSYVNLGHWARHALAKDKAWHQWVETRFSK